MWVSSPGLAVSMDRPALLMLHILPPSLAPQLSIFVIVAVYSQNHSLKMLN